MGLSSRLRQASHQNPPGREGAGHPEGHTACRNTDLLHGPVLMLTLSPKQVGKDNQ